MARPAVDVVRDCFAAWDRGDLDAVLSNYEDDVEVDATRLLDGSFRGRAAVREYYERIFGAFKLRNDELRLVETPAGVAAVVHMRAVGVTSGANTEARFGYIFQVHEGLVSRVVFYPEVDEMPLPQA